MDAVGACRSVLIEVLTILGKDLDKLAVVGGWVPELTFPHEGHVGSLDVDLALDPRKLKSLAYESIRKKLVDSGYRQDPDLSNRLWKKRGRPQLPPEAITNILISLVFGVGDSRKPIQRSPSGVVVLMVGRRRQTPEILRHEGSEQPIRNVQTFGAWHSPERTTCVGPIGFSLQPLSDRGERSFTIWEIEAENICN